jgi:two-component system response regulator AtoC
VGSKTDRFTTNVDSEPGVGTLKHEFVGGICPALLTLESVIAEIAPTNIPVLLVGESGTGKEMFARHIHALSSRSAESLVKLSCASLNEETLSSELGLHGNRHHNSAHITAGTVILDEISELDASSQRILLYGLPDGDTRARPGVLTARIVSTTSRKLDEEMQAGRFRNELYYRINGVCLRLPPLRERKDDIPMLSEFFLTKHAAQLGRPRFPLSQRTLQVLVDHSWPGNIRELENVVKNIIALGDEQLAVSGLGSVPGRASRIRHMDTHIRPLKVAARAASREAERELILQALERTHWNRKRAAHDLQISYKSLLYKLKQIKSSEAEAI